MNRTFVINSLQLSQGTDGTISGTINLDFYSLKKLFPDHRMRIILAGHTIHLKV